MALGIVSCAGSAEFGFFELCGSFFFDRAKALQDKGDLDGAITEYREAIRLKPELAKAHNDLGVALNAKGDHSGANAELREALRSNPDFAEPHYNLGVALEAKGEEQAALAEYRKASELDSGNKEIRAAYERLSKKLTR